MNLKVEKLAIQSMILDPIINFQKKWDLFILISGNVILHNQKESKSNNCCRSTGCFKKRNIWSIPVETKNNLHIAVKLRRTLFFSIRRY